MFQRKMIQVWLTTLVLILVLVSAALAHETLALSTMSRLNHGAVMVAAVNQDPQTTPPPSTLPPSNSAGPTNVSPPTSQESQSGSPPTSGLADGQSQADKNSAVPAVAPPLQQPNRSGLGKSGAGGGAANSGAAQLPVVKRAKRPVFQERDWDGIYFSNLFQEGLNGPRPQLAAANTSNNSTGKAMAPENVANAGEAGEAVADAGSSWNQLVSRESIEDEIKRLQQQLAQQVTTATKFKTEYGTVRQTLSMLSLWFAVIDGYQADVRWREQAGAAQASFARAAANARVASDQAFQYAKARLEDLTQLVRGGSVSFPEPKPEQLDWSLVIDRTSMMLRLDQLLQELKQATANDDTIAENAEQIVHQSSLIAVMGRVMVQENMDDADDEDYAKLSERMTQAATTLRQATTASDLALVKQTINRLEQSCNKCHEDWK